MTFGAAISHNIRNMFRFTGRDPRSAFWWYVLFYFLGYLAANTIDATIWLMRAEVLFAQVQDPEEMFEFLFGNPWFFFTVAPVSMIWMLINLVPLFSCGIRRRHDCDKSGWVFAVVCLVGAALYVPLIIIMFDFFSTFSEVMLAAQNGAEIGTRFGQDGALEQIMQVMSILSVLSLLQMLAGIVIIVMMATRGTVGSNRYGVDPLVPLPPDLPQGSR